MKRNINPNILNLDGWGPLHIAIKKGVNEAV
jgi:hypothetical protein